jgi:hypothetical protein
MKQQRIIKSKDNAEIELYQGAPSLSIICMIQYPRYFIEGCICGRHVWRTRQRL